MKQRNLNFGMLAKSQLAKDTETARRLMKQLDISLSKLEGLIKEGDRDGFIKESFNYEKIAERMCNNARLLPVSTGKPNALSHVKNIIIEENNVEVGFTEEGWFKTVIPCLLTKKEKGDPSWIRATLSAAMNKYFSENERQQIREDSIIIFRHCYSKDRTYREYRDHDNIELNAIVDMVALHVLVDDSPMRLKHFYCSCVQEKDETQVFVVPTKDFVKWIEKYNIGGDG